MCLGAGLMGLVLYRAQGVAGPARRGMPKNRGCRQSGPASIFFLTTSIPWTPRSNPSWPHERSRVAEGTGPTTPQQPAGRVVPTTPSETVLTPARLAGEDQTRVPQHTLSISILHPPCDSWRRGSPDTPARSPTTLLRSDEGSHPRGDARLLHRPEVPRVRQAVPEGSRSTSAPTTSARSKSTTTTRPSREAISRGPRSSCGR